MLDQQTSNLLQNLNKICDDSSYKVIEKSEILSKMSKKYKTDSDGLKFMINHLQERNYLSVKYADEQVYCLAVLPKGRLFEEKNEELIREKKKFNKLIVTTMILSCVASFVGSFLALVVCKIAF